MEKIEEEIRNLEEDHNRLDKDIRGTGKVEKLKEERDEIALKVSLLIEYQVRSPLSFFPPPCSLPSPPFCEYGKRNRHLSESGM